MGCYAYCVKCSGGMGPSTLEEVKAEEHLCRHCGHAHVPNRTLEDFIEDLMEDQEETKKVLAETNEALLTVAKLLYDSLTSSSYSASRADRVELDRVIQNVQRLIATPK